MLRGSGILSEVRSGIFCVLIKNDAQTEKHRQVEWNNKLT